ncbi:hypothetical protein [Maribacter sp.]|uniref:hypothetical protein n=1 Tax=Maribacter sp. TaxID=1897614 RepID=UPI0025BFB229|nr:hypothetical protein [Maribacter sp.]
MNNKALDCSDLFLEFSDARTYLIERIKLLLYGYDKDVFDKIDFYKDSIYLNPFLFSCLDNGEPDELDFIIGCNSKEATFNYKVNFEGEIYIHGFGVYTFEEKNQKIKIIKKNETFIFFDLNGKELKHNIRFNVTNPQNIEFFNIDHRLINNLFENSTVVSGSHYNNEFNNAMVILAKINPVLFEIITKSVKKVVFFKGSDNSFASIKTHGIIYLNVNDEYGEAYFLDDIVHQSGHVIFNTLTLKDKANFFKPNQNIKSDKDENLEHDLYGRFHGLYTICLSTICLSQALEKKAFAKSQEFEACGRIADNMAKYKRLLEKLVKPEMCTKQGLEWLSIFKRHYDKLREINQWIIQKYDVSNQPYVFNSEIFRESNKTVN